MNNSVLIETMTFQHHVLDDHTTQSFVNTVDAITNQRSLAEYLRVTHTFDYIANALHYLTGYDIDAQMHLIKDSHVMPLSNVKKLVIGVIEY